MKRALLLLVVLAGCASHPTPRPLATERLTSAIIEPEPARVQVLPSRPVIEGDVVLAGFHVHATPAALAHPRCEDLFHALEVQLEGLVASFPAGMRIELVRTPIEITNVDELLAELDAGRTESLATTIAAGWLAKRHPAKIAEAQRLYERASAGSRETATRAKDGLSYFAQLSAAWFGRSVTLPGDRARLRAIDPEGAAFVAKTWPIDELPARPTADEAEKRALHGFDVLVDKRGLGHAEMNAALAKLEALLGEVVTFVPAKALATLRKRNVIVVRWADDPDTAWQLWSHDGMVDILDARTFLASTKNDPYAIVHELAHSFHGAHPELHARLEKAFAAARAAHLYEGLYASTNEKEYFAEMSKAYLARSPRAPHTRAELEKYDPEGFAIVDSVWRGE